MEILIALNIIVGQTINQETVIDPEVEAEVEVVVEAEAEAEVEVEAEK